MKLKNQFPTKPCSLHGLRRLVKGIDKTRSIKRSTLALLSNKGTKLQFIQMLTAKCCD